jgi:Ca2+-binding EF-hand superfamily protein
MEKLTQGWAIVASLLVSSACVPPNQRSSGRYSRPQPAQPAATAISTTTQGNNQNGTVTGQSYATDMVASAADDQTAGQGNMTVDASLKDELRADHLGRLAKYLMSLLDKDKSGSLSLEEFLGAMQLLAVGQSPLANWSKDQADRVTKILTEEFNKHSGDDKVLSEAELTTLLAAQAPRICSYRKSRRPHQGPPPPPPPKGHIPPDVGCLAIGCLDWEQILAKFDKNDDKMLDKTEFAAFLEYLKSQHPPRPTWIPLPYGTSAGPAQVPPHSTPSAPPHGTPSKQ